MIGKELVDHMRVSMLSDEAVPYGWESAELIRFLNYAEVQACRRSNLLIDATTPNDYGTAATAFTWGTDGTTGTFGPGIYGSRPLGLLDIVPDQAVYNLSPKILKVLRCQLRSMTEPLIGPVSPTELDEIFPGWWGTAGTVGTAGSGGYPAVFLNDPGNIITFVRAPSEADVAYLTVSRLPLSQFDMDTAPEIAEQYHIGLCDWAAHLAFLKPDSDTYNPTLAKAHEEMFTRNFGPLPDAYHERMKRILRLGSRMRPRPFGS